MLGVKLEINYAAGSPGRVTTKAETGINEASGGSPPDEATSTAACEACFAERHMISPVDPPGAKARVWGTGENADMCGLCVELWDIPDRTRTSRPGRIPTARLLKSLSGRRSSLPWLC